ncbi:MAG: hypothetical protein H0X64_09205 [Gemmatimonadaceae bacterium]|nr:hypothetical protein [Gemmatimonadaceae bacterium]
MRAIRSTSALVALLLLAGCGDLLNGVDSRDPTNLSYSITTETSTGTLRGVMLTWEAPRARDAWSYSVYGRPSTVGEWYLVGITTSTTFHDAGAPQRQYYVAARDADDSEFGRTRTITIEAPVSLAAPDALTGISLNRAVQLGWADNARISGGSAFRHYRVFSTAVTPSGGCDLGRWEVEGATGSNTFLVSGISNGVSRCFAVTAMSMSGVESAMSRAWIDTPRYDARHVVIDAFALRPASSGFIFHEAGANRFGAVVDGSRSDADFRVEQAQDGSFVIRAMRDAVRLAAFGSAPVPDLTSIDVAPATGYGASDLTVQPGHAYVFRIVRADGVRYGAVRIAYVAAGHVVLDWAYQSAAGNPELVVGFMP